MEGILKFDLPEDQDEYERAIYGSIAIDALFQISSNVRRRFIKYKDYNDEQFRVAEEIFEAISEEIPEELIKFM